MNQFNVSVQWCLFCSVPCYNCINTSSTCLSCISAYYSFINVSTINNNSVECLQSCPIDITVSNDVAMTCDYCFSPC